jgi:hypothetical protein
MLNRTSRRAQRTHTLSSESGERRRAREHLSPRGTGGATATAISLVKPTGRKERHGISSTLSLFNRAINR